MALKRRDLLAGMAGVALAPALARAAATGEPITVGVSGPLTGPAAQYGAQWKRGFDLALDEINGGGGVKGRPIEYVFEDRGHRAKIRGQPEDHHGAWRFRLAGLDGGVADLSAR
jgi:hypothetical protein